MKHPALASLATALSLGLLLAACASHETSTPEAAIAPPPTPFLSNARAEYEQAADNVLMKSREASARMAAPAMLAALPVAPLRDHALPRESREKYQNLADNPVKQTAEESVSTFSLDVDTGSYSNVRRFLNQGRLPPKDAVRVEELVNYFPYAYPAPTSPHPFAVSLETTASPWKAGNLLLRVGVKAVDRNVAAMPPANLVFLVDVSGSMASPDKLPLVQSTLNLLTAQLRPQDRVAIVVYSGYTAVELASTPGDQKEKIRAAIAGLRASGATAGENALRLAYAEARSHYIWNGINRILLVTDGDFNVGTSDIEQLKDIVKRERESGISLTTLGFGQGNYQEALMEQIANVGNGNYSYIDSLNEARKVLVEELASTFNTVAKDVKLQIEFNPDRIAEWRLIGYENRVLREEDFRNDKVDAGEVGAGKSVTALYELTPVGANTLHGERRYGKSAPAALHTDLRQEIGFLRVRYKQPDGNTSVELSQAIADTRKTSLDTASDDLRFAAAVAAFGQLLRQSPYTGTFGYADVKALAEKSAGHDKNGYRREFLHLVELARALTPSEPDTTRTVEETLPRHARHQPRPFHEPQ